MATALDDLLEAFPNGWTPADSTKQSGSSLFDTRQSVPSIMTDRD